VLSSQLASFSQHGARDGSVARDGAVLVLLMPPFALLLLGAMVAAAAPSALAQPLPPPLEPATVAAPLEPNPGFTSDVETALDDLTRLQCSLLGLMLINSQPCPVP
jgi:DNA-binding helix-hairpin-helix protein with protein kinase domain